MRLLLSVRGSRWGRNGTCAASPAFTAPSTWGSKWRGATSICCMHASSRVCIRKPRTFKPLRSFFFLLLFFLFMPCTAFFTLPGQKPPCRWRSGPHGCRGDVKDALMDVTRTKPQGQKKDGGSEANSEVKLPKIVNRWQDWWQMIIYSDSTNTTYGIIGTMLSENLVIMLYMCKPEYPLLLVNVIISSQAGRVSKTFFKSILSFKL